MANRVVMVQDAPLNRHRPATAADTLTDGAGTPLAVGAAGALVSDAFVTIGHPADLTAERNLAVAASLSLTDGGANADVTLGTVAFTGDITTAANSYAATIPADTVTYAKMQNISAASRLLGRGSAAGAGDPEELTLGANLSLAGTVLSATGGGVTITQATVTLPTPAALNHKVTVTDAAVVNSTYKVMVALAGVAETEVNSSDTVDAYDLKGLAAAGSFEFQGWFKNPISGPLKINYMVTA